MSYLLKTIDFFTSLRLTVVTLCLFIVLVFIGTLAQVEVGIWDAQARYFRSFFIYWTSASGNIKIPVFPGGYLLGAVLLINLIAAHIKRFSFKKKKIGLMAIHAGIIMLLLSQVATDLFQVESNMRLEEGQSKNYSDNTFHSELAVIDITSPDFDEVVSIPDTILRAKGEISHSKLPFTVKVREYFPNAEPKLRGPMVSNGNPQATRGVGDKVEFTSLPITSKPDERNIPAAVVEIVTSKGSEGTWLVSNWLSEETLAPILIKTWKDFGKPLVEPQTFLIGERKYLVALRPMRHYKDFTIELNDFKHDLYKGTAIPKNFSSQIKIKDSSGYDRDVLISMNEPLRYKGETYYQASFDKLNPNITVLQVVRNPGWLTPYIACGLVGVGLATQFLISLFSFSRKRKTS